MFASKLIYNELKIQQMLHVPINVTYSQLPVYEVHLAKTNSVEQNRRMQFGAVDLFCIIDK